MKKWEKKMMSYGLLVTMSVGLLAGCGKESNTTGGGKSEGGKSTLNKDCVYREKPLSDLGIDVELEQYQDIAIRNNRLYIQGDFEDGITRTKVISVNLDGSDRKEFLLDRSDQTDNDAIIDTGMEEEGAETIDSVGEDETVKEDTAEQDSKKAATDIAVVEGEEATDETASEDEEAIGDDYDNQYCYYDKMYPDGQGNIVISCNSYHESYIDGEYNYEDCYKLLKYTEDGTLLAEKKITGENENDYVSVSSMILDDSGNVYVLMQDTHIGIFDSDFNQVDDIVVEGFSYFSDGFINGNQLVCTGWDENYEKIQYVTMGLSDHKVSEIQNFVEGISNYAVYAGGSDTSEYLLVNYTGIYSWSVGDAEPKKKMDYVDSDVNTSYLNHITPIDENSFIATYDDSISWKQIISVFEKVDPKDVVDKKVLKIGCYYLDSLVRGQIVKFNKTNEAYRFQVIDYASYETENESGVEKMNTDIISGNVPDIFILDSSLSVDNLMEKGLFEDLMPYLKKDTKIDQNDLAQNVIDAYSRDGKWYVMVPHFSVATFATKASNVGGKNGWTLDELSALLEKYPDASFAEEVTKDSFLENALRYTGEQFIDWSTGSCKFNSEEFISLLELANRFPAEYDYDDDEYWQEYYQNYDRLYRDNKLLAYSLNLNDFSEINRLKQGTFGEDISYVGFPTKEGQGAFIRPASEFAISTKCQNKEVAWEFLSYFLQDEYQLDEDDMIFGLPISKKAMQEVAKSAMEKSHYTGEDGKEVYEDETYWIGDVEIKIEPMTQKEVDEVLDYVYSISSCDHLNDSVNTLVCEEAKAFFSGQKSAKDVADVIQSRVQIYVNENM